MNGQVPPELGDLDRRLRAVQFEPRASLGPELEGRARRGDVPDSQVNPWQTFAVRSALALVGAAGVLALAVSFMPSPRQLDVCCQDLDGSGDGRDGLVLTMDLRGRVTGLLLYEDTDHSGSRSDGDLARFERGGDLEMAEPPHEDGHRTIVRCCTDLDGEGVADDGVMVMGHLPGHIHFAAVIRGDGRRQLLR
jgi:hypothetical protein